MQNFILHTLILCLIATTALAEPKKAKEYITEILSQPEFQTTREESRWRYIGESSIKEREPTEPISPNFIGFIAQLFELLLWILLGVGIVLLIIYGSRWIGQLRLQKTPKSDYTATPHLLEKGIKKALLPTNISQEAWKFWQSGEPLIAISLLYRGALSVLITRDELNIDDSATENECIRLVKQKQAVELTTYFSGLTRAWQKIAYAEQQPSDIEAQRLCEEWQQHFG